jgi:hypothetical protein
LKIHRITLAPALDLLSGAHQNAFLSRKTKRRRFVLTNLLFPSICKQFNPQSEKATQNKLFKNATHATEEEDCNFIRLFPIFCDFLRLNLQTI